MKPFVHLHLHTEFSLLDGAARIKKLVKVCKSYNMPAVAITDHGNMYGAIAFYDACKKEGIKPIIGCEFYVADDLHVKSGRSKYSHLVLLAKNEEGYINLCKLNSIAFKDGFYYKPRIDHAVLKTHSAGLVCLSACIAGDIPQAILKRQFDEAEQLVRWFKGVFGDDFYLELQNHQLMEQIEVNEKLREYSKKYNIKTVATNDVHYIYKEDAEMQDVLMCVQMQKTFDDPDRMKFPNDEFYLKTYDQMAEIFPADLDALATTLEIAEKCNFDFVFGHYLFPHFKTPDGVTPSEYMKNVIAAGLKNRYGEVTKEIEERAHEEFSLIEKQGFVQYFLVVWDYIRQAKDLQIPVGPGRGSGAGSIVAYAMGITNIDPLKYDLLFERFLHNERVSAPDFDVDFADYRREEVIDYVKEKYGEDRVVKIATFGTMAAKNAIKDVGRVLRVPYSVTDKLTKAFPDRVPKPDSIKKIFGLHTSKEGDKDFGVDFAVPELVQMYNSDDSIKKVVDLAIKLEDMPRQVSTHACGVVIGADNLEKFMPLSRNGEDITTQYNMVDIERLGHLKMDFLGLRNLSDIERAIEYVKANHGVEINFDKCNYDDAEVYKLISTGNTKAIFQIESSGFQKFMKELQPSGIEDIIAGVSLYRPGPMDAIPRYIKNKHNPNLIVYDHPILQPILEVTYGCIVYQEQVMRIVQDMAGYTLGQADMVRRMMGKKKLDAMRAEKHIFLHGKPAEGNKPAIDGALKRGVDEKTGTKIWEQMESFASYAFNKSHAAAYSLITYQTAYLKKYYEAEFLTSVLNNRITNADEIKNYVTYAKEEKIEVLPPDINKSQTYFSVKDGKIRFGLAALKNVGINVVEAIIDQREKFGDYKSIEDFIERLDATALNKRCIESMILSGAFDCFGAYRSQLMRVFPEIVDRVLETRKKQMSGQTSLFDDLLKDHSCNLTCLPDIPEYDEQVKLKLEKEVVGVYISGHPLSRFLDNFKEFSFNSQMIEDVSEDELGDESEQVFDSIKDQMHVTSGGIISEVKKLFTKNGNKEMAFAKIEDLYGSYDIMFFPQSYARLKELIKVDSLVKIEGKVSIRSGEKPSIIVDKMEIWSNGEKEIQNGDKTLYLKFDTTNKTLYNNILELFSVYSGNTEVVIKCASTNKPYKCHLKVNTDSLLPVELLSYVTNENIIIK